jgi:uncharacterized protein YkwD
VVRRIAVTLAVVWAAVLPGRSSAGPKGTWAVETSSPRKGAPDDAMDAALVAACGGGIEASLVAAAREVAQVLVAKGELPDAQEIDWRLRKAGDPHVWPRTWGAQTQGPLDRAKLAGDVKKWLGAKAARARCGVATVRAGKGDDTREAAVVLAIDPVADLAALPTHVKPGAWLELDATLFGGTNGRVVVLPPTGAPKTVLASTSLGVPAHVRSRFALATPGRHVIQVLADDDNGPRPVLEAEVYAGVEPPESPPSSAVPGEEKGDAATDPVDALLRRINGAREAEGLAPLALDQQLSLVSTAHAEAMRKAKVLGHDVGDGDPADRVAEAGIVKWKLIGENVAKAKTERAAHRAIYASPSHRGNVLEARFKRVGIGVASDAKTGYLWVAELYGG